MPDADIIHRTLPGRYKKVYKLVCEWSGDKEYIAEEALKPLVKDVKLYGSEPINLILEGANYLKECASLPLFMRTINWIEEKKKFDLLRQRFVGNKRAMNLAMDTIKEKLLEFRQGIVDTSPLYVALVNNYIYKIYQARFEDVVHHTSEHYLDTPPDIIRARILKIRPMVDRGIEQLALQIVSEKKINSLKYKHPKRKIKKISLEDNVFDL